MIIIKFWIIALIVVVAIGLCFYFIPAVTLKILSVIAKVLIKGMLFLAKTATKGIKGVIKKFKDRRDKSDRNHSNPNNNDNSNKDITTKDITIKDSRVFIVNGEER